MLSPSTLLLLSALICLPCHAQCGSSVMTPFNGSTYCATGGGPMFDVVATTALTVTGFDVNHNAGSSTISIYVVTGGGSFVGNELNAGAWTLLGTAPITSAGPGAPTQVPLVLSVPVPAGAVQGFHVRAGAGGLRYTSGSASGTVGQVLASSPEIQVLVGNSQCDLGGGPFTGSVPSPRAFNGVVHYCSGPGIVLVQNQPGTLVVNNSGLLPGAETWNALTVNDPCPGGPGSGPLLGLCASTPGALSVLLGQVTSPINPGNPFHFPASSTALSWGPFGGIGPGLVLEAVCFYFDPTTASLVAGPVSTLTTQ